MIKSNSNPIKLAVYGMDSRSINTMMLFLKGPCEGAAIITNETGNAEVDVFDADVANSYSMLERHLQEKKARPTVVLSLREFNQEGVFHLQKPIKKNDLLKVLEQAITFASVQSEKPPAEETHTEETGKESKDLFDDDDLYDFIKSSSWDEPKAAETSPQILRKVSAPAIPEPKTENQNTSNSTTSATQADDQVAPMPTASAQSDAVNINKDETVSDKNSLPATEIEDAENIAGDEEKIELKTYFRDLERNKTSKHQTAMRLDEKSFADFIGELDGVNVNDPKQFANAGYNPMDYFQGYFQRALNTSQMQNQAVMIRSQWCPIAIFPKTREIWLDAPDSEINFFASIKLRHKTMISQLTTNQLDADAAGSKLDLDKFHNMDAFVWKLACWTSKGRYPQAIDYTAPVYLATWPNFTRLLITPHALRIAALMIKGPRTMANIAQMLNIKPQYVFVFVSAAYAVGLVGQARRSSDFLVEPQDVKPTKGQGLLSRILNKLRK